MTVTVSCLVETKYLEASQTTEYTSSGLRTIIDKCVATNSSGSAATIALNIVPSGGSAGASNIMLQTKSLNAGESYSCPEVVGAVLESGDFLSGIAGTASAIVIRVSGRKVT
jgi:hypothetical protein